MIRSITVAGLLALASPAFAVPVVTVALEAEPVLKRPTNAAPIAHGAITLSGVPKSWENLLNPEATVSTTDLCRALSNLDMPEGEELPFDPAAVVLQALGQTKCRGETG